MSLKARMPRVAAKQLAIHDRPAAAFFDMDLTVLDTSSSYLYVHYLRRHHLITRRQMALVGWWTVQYKMGRLNFPRLTVRLMRLLNPGTESETRRKMADWVVKDVTPHVTERARRQIAAHQSAGHHIALLSATTRYVVEPLARHLGLNPAQALYTHLEVADGQFTGKVIDPACYGSGKIHWAERFALEHGVMLADSYFYTDSYSDRPLLERVGHPVAVNPDQRLARHARRRSWPILRFY